MSDQVRRHVLIVIALAALSARCTPPKPPAIAVVALDASCSRTNVPVFDDGWRKVLSSIEPGERLVLVRIGSDLRQFRPDLDVLRPEASILWTNPIIAKRQQEAFLQDSSAAYRSALSVPCSSRTAILSTLATAAKFLETTASRRRLICLSDMLEDAEGLRFETEGIGERETERILRHLKADRGLPDLTGVDIFVGGVAAPTSKIGRQVEQFWAAYFRATGALLKPEHYGPVLLGVER